MNRRLRKVDGHMVDASRDTGERDCVLQNERRAGILFPAAVRQQTEEGWNQEAESGFTHGRHAALGQLLANVDNAAPAPTSCYNRESCQ